MGLTPPAMTNVVASTLGLPEGSDINAALTALKDMITSAGSYDATAVFDTTSKALISLGGAATPSQVLTALNTLLGGKAKMVSGSYVGTGTFDDTHKNSIAFTSLPKLLVIQHASGGGATIISPGCTNAKTLNTDTGSWVDLTISYVGNTVYWYGWGPAWQLNVSGATYKYVALL